MVKVCDRCFKAIEIIYEERNKGIELESQMKQYLYNRRIGSSLYFQIYVIIVGVRLMVSNYYQYKVEAVKFIGKLAIRGNFDLKTINALVYEKFGFSEKFVTKTIENQIQLSKWLWVGEILKDLNTYEQEVEQKWKDNQKKEMQELDDLFKSKPDHSPNNGAD